MSRESNEHGIVNLPALRAAVREDQLRRLIEEEEEGEKEAQDGILQASAQEEDVDGPSEEASRDKSEKEVEYLGLNFLGVISDAFSKTKEGDDVDQKMLEVQGLDLRIGSVTRRSFPVESR